MKRRTLVLAVGNFVIFLALLATSVASAQSTTYYWSQPYPLSSQTGQSGEQVMISDTFGYVHLFWPETGLNEGHTLLFYSRFDGETWSSPVDILLTPPRTRISATADLEGNVHLVYTNRNNGLIYYTKAPIQDATSAQGWLKPKQLDISVQWVDLKVDSTGVVHLLYTGYDKTQPGVYYANSFDSGQTWSRSVWLDPDIPSDLEPGQIQLELGEGDRLHAAWFYWDQTFLGRWIRYAHSFDQGQNWSVPFTVDEVEAGSDELRLPAPSMAVSGSDVHIIWAGDFTTHRKHRVSRDSGKTWNQAEFVFGDLHGLAISDGLAVDALGRLHFFGQIRWPQGIYHVYLSQSRWSSPSMIYLIAQDALVPIGERIHAHRIQASIRAGNQLVITFTSSPSDPQSILYTMYRTLPDVPNLGILPLPERIPAQTQDAGLASPTPLPEIPTEVPPVVDFPLDRDPVGRRTPSSGLVWGTLPVILLVAFIVTIRYLFRKNN